MKKHLIACSMASVFALVAGADVTPITEEQAWFDVFTTATNHGVLAANGDALCELTDNKFEIDSDLANPVVFTAADALTQQVAKVTFNLDAAIVPNGALQAFDNSNAPKIAFALYQASETTTNFMAWVGSAGWITLTGGTIPAEDSAYTVTMELDNQVMAATKVRFSVTRDETTTVLKPQDATDGWIAYSTPVKDEVKVNFVGCGKVASFEGKQIAIIGEIVVIGGKGSVEINNEAKAAFAATVTGATTVEDFLAANAKTSFEESAFDSNLTVAEAYALGLVVKSGEKMVPISDGNGALKVKADAQASTTDGIPVNLNIQPPADSGATITYQLQGSANGTDYTNIGGATGDQSAIKIQTSDIGVGGGKYRFFKVKTIVTLKNAPAAQD